MWKESFVCEGSILFYWIETIMETLDGAIFWDAFLFGLNLEKFTKQPGKIAEKWLRCISVLWVNLAKRRNTQKKKFTWRRGSWRQRWSTRCVPRTLISVGSLRFWSKRTRAAEWKTTATPSTSCCMSPALMPKPGRVTSPHTATNFSSAVPPAALRPSKTWFISERITWREGEILALAKLMAT